MGMTLVQSTISPSQNVIQVYKGQSKDVQLIITAPSVDVDNNPITIPFDLTGCSLYFTVKRTGFDPKTLIAKTTANSAQLLIGTPPTLGKATIFVVPTDTNLLEPGKYQFDVWVRLPSGEQYPVVEISEFIVEQPITIIT